MAKRKISGKSVLITGASSGIGWHLAIQLAAAGATVVLCARREDRLGELAEQIQADGGTAIVVAGDVADEDCRQRLIARCEQDLGGLDILINNAGIGAMGRFDEATPERIRQIFEVNFFALAELIRISLPMLKRSDDPIIVNISSVLGHKANTAPVSLPSMVLAIPFGQNWPPMVSKCCWSALARPTASFLTRRLKTIRIRTGKNAERCHPRSLRPKRSGRFANAVMKSY